MMRVIYSLTAAFTLMLAACVHAPPPADPLLVNIEQGAIRGALRENGARAWLGLPYAAPPVDALRWRAPQAPAHWADTRDATSAGARCPQESALPAGPEVRFDEDCLYLNVWAPSAADANANLPVMFWIHGGGNETGAGDLYNGASLAEKQNVIVVSINYRLGALGWFHHAALFSEDATPEERSGNFGTLDQIAALHWVQDNIQAFGGDPSHVMAFGESAGGWNTMALLSSPLAKGLFANAIVQSGNAPFYTQAQAENFIDDAEPGRWLSSSEMIAHMLIDDGRFSDRAAARAYLQSAPNAEILAYLREQSNADFDAARTEVFAARAAETGAGAYQRFMPSLVADGVVIKARPFPDAVANGEIVVDVPVILGTTREEHILGILMFGEGIVNWAIPGQRVIILDEKRFDIVVEYMTRVWRAAGADIPARALSDAGHAPAYSYRFEFDNFLSMYGIEFVRASDPERSVVGATHAAEVSPLFDIDVFPPRPESAEAYDDMADSMKAYWAEFARTGAPGDGGAGLPEWTPWRDTAGDGGYLAIDTADDGGIRMERDVETIERIWTDFNNDPRMNQEERCAMYAFFKRYPFGANHFSVRFRPQDEHFVTDAGCAP